MRERSRELAGKRAALQARCETQRREIGGASQAIEARLARADRAIAMARRIVSPPVLVGVALAIVVLLGPRRLLRAAGKGVALLSTVRRVRRHGGPRKKDRARGALALIRSGLMH